MGSIKPEPVGGLMVNERFGSLERVFSLNQFIELLLKTEKQLLDCIGDEDASICISLLKPYPKAPSMFNVPCRQPAKAPFDDC